MVGVSIFKPVPLPPIFCINLVALSTTDVTVSARPFKKSPTPLSKISLANCLNAIVILETLVERLSILFSIAPPNLLSKPSCSASVIILAPSAVLPKVAISSFARPNSSCNIFRAGIPLSLSIFSSSKPNPPPADLCTTLTNASKTPN